MTLAYRFLSNTPGSIVFADSANISRKVSFQNSQAPISKGSNVTVLRNSITLRTPEVVNLKPDCESACDRAVATRVVEIRTSAPLRSKDLIKADLLEVIRLIDKAGEDLGLWEGFLPPLNATFTDA